VVPRRLYHHQASVHVASPIPKRQRSLDCVYALALPELTLASIFIPVLLTVASATHWQHECVVWLLRHTRWPLTNRAICEPDVRGFRLDIVSATDAWKLANERQVLLIAFARVLKSQGH
jgi:hypothetical protein